MIRATPVYNDPPEVLAIFDVRIPGTAARLHRERAAWAEKVISKRSTRVITS